LLSNSAFQDIFDRGYPGLCLRVSYESVSHSASHPQTPCQPEIPPDHDAYAAVSGYCTAFDWEHLLRRCDSGRAESPGSGLAVVKAQTHEAWRAKRMKNNDQLCDGALLPLECSSLLPLPTQR